MRQELLPVEVLADALQDRPFPASGRLICGVPIGTAKPKPAVKDHSP